MVGFDEFAARPKVIALHCCEPGSDDLSVVVPTAQSNLMFGLAQVRVPPVQIHGGAVIEDVQIVAPYLAPLNAGFGRFESIVFDLHLEIVAPSTDRIGLPRLLSANSATLATQTMLMPGGFMGVIANRRLDLLDEVDAFRLGFGRSQSLTAAIRDAVLLVPVIDDRILITTLHGIDWICAFTDEQQFARHLAARGELVDAHYQCVLGSRVFDTLIPSLPEPTGVFVDIASEMPLGFPPASKESSR